MCPHVLSWLARDWFDVFLVQRVGNDSDVQIRERKNLTGISYDVDETDVVTRIMPTGQDADGNIMYLPELYLDSPNIGAYVHPKWIHLSVSEAKEVTDGDEPRSREECFALMRQAAQAEYDKGCDLPTVTLKVDFVNCADTEEYRQYAALSNIFLGDSVRVIARRIGVEVSMRMTQYTYDCLTRRYISVTLGTVDDTLEGSMVSARQLASGSITGAKLALNSVRAGQLQSGSVGSLQIRNAAIGSAHIQDASITRAHIAEALIDVLNVNALTAVTAKIKELAAGSITADELYTSIAMIATAQLTTANIVNANIETCAQVLATLNDTAPLEQKAERLQAEQDAVNDRIERLIRENAQVAQDQQEYKLRIEALYARCEELKSSMAKVESQIMDRAGRSRNAEAYLQRISRTEPLTVFDESVFAGTVDCVIVCQVQGKRDRQMIFRFKDGTEIPMTI